MYPLWYLYNKMWQNKVTINIILYFDNSRKDCASSGAYFQICFIQKGLFVILSIKKDNFKRFFKITVTTMSLNLKHYRYQMEE